MPVAPLLVFGWGNPSRGDDALGPAFVERLGPRLPAAQRVRVELLTDFQLQVEHALDLHGRERVLLVDADLHCAAPFEIRSLTARHRPSVSTHSVSPEALLEVYERLHGFSPPPCSLLAIQARQFGLGQPISQASAHALEAALAWTLERWLIAAE